MEKQIKSQYQFHGPTQSHFQSFTSPTFSNYTNSSSSFVDPKKSNLDEALAEFLKVHSSFMLDNREQLKRKKKKQSY